MVGMEVRTENRLSLVNAVANAEQPALNNSVEHSLAVSESFLQAGSDFLATAAGGARSGDLREGVADLLLLAELERHEQESLAGDVFYRCSRLKSHCLERFPYHQRHPAGAFFDCRHSSP